jgi:signal peptidase I
VVIWLPVLAVILGILYREKIMEDMRLLKSAPKAWLHTKWKEWGEPFVIAAILALLIRTFLMGPYKIPSGSMIPTLLIGDRIFVDKVSYRFRTPQRGDIIVFKSPEEPKKDFVKRLIGFEGDKIEIRSGKVYINDKILDIEPFSKIYYYNTDHDDKAKYGKTDQLISVPEDHFFVLGDNSNNSSDSRFWGLCTGKKFSR